MSHSTSITYQMKREILSFSNTVCGNSRFLFLKTVCNDPTFVTSNM